MFALIDLSIGSFAIVKEVEARPNTFPMNVHGFINVVSVQENMAAVLLPPQASDELIQSGEVEALKKKALELTEEAIADEFPE